MTPLQTPERRTPARPGADGNSRSRLTSNQIEGLRARAKLYEITDPACARLKLRVRPSGAKVWAYRFYWAGRRQLLQLGARPETGLALARERALGARRVLSEGIDPRKAGLVKSSHGDAAPLPSADTRSTRPSLRRRPIARQRRETDLSEHPDDLPVDRHCLKFLAHEFYHRHIVKERRYIRDDFARRDGAGRAD